MVGYRDWKLSIWVLEGPPAGWRQQLEKRYAATPVFALLAGLGGMTWAPVHRFCEELAIPCILPNVDAPPPPEEHGWWSVYYSAGVGVEAEVMARSIPRAAKVAQVFRPGTVGAVGAARLARLRSVLNLDPTRPVPDGIDAVVLWLTSAEAARYAAASAKAWLSATTAVPDRCPYRRRDARRVARACRRHVRGTVGFERVGADASVERGDFRIQQPSPASSSPLRARAHGRRPRQGSS